MKKGFQGHFEVTDPPRYQTKHKQKAIPVSSPRRNSLQSHQLSFI